MDVKIPLPSVVERSEVIGIYSIEYEPIQVGYKQIREKTYLFEKATKAKEMKQLQRLLYGSLLTHINSGPLAIAQTFLGQGAQYSDHEKEKLRRALKMFMDAVIKGVKLHGEWVTTQTEFIQLHVSFEVGMDKLVNILKVFV